MEFEVTKLFDSWIAAKFAGQEAVRSFLLRHERKRLCVDCLCEQIRIAELSRIGKVFNAFRYKYLINQCAQMFCTFALKHAEDDALSRAEKQRRQDEANHFQQLEAEMAEMTDEALSTKIVSRPSG